MNREMKDSGVEWIGEIPEKWNVCKIDSLYFPRSTKVSDKDYPPLSVTMKGIVPQLASTAKTDDHDNRKLVKKGDFAINSRSDRRGSCGISEYNGSVSLINTVLQPRHGMNNKYYNWLFHSDMFSSEFYRLGHGIVDDLRTTSWQEMKKMVIPAPSPTEQQQIVNFLDRKCTAIDTAIEKTKKSIEKLEEYKKAVITKVVTKGIDPNAKMKDSGVEWIGEIPETWEIRRIKTVGTYKNGLTYSPDDLTDETKGTLVLRSSNIKDGKLVLQDNLYVRKHISDKLRVQKGDILICSRNGSRTLIGKNVLIDNDMDASFGAFMMIYRSKDPYYIHWVLKSEMMSYYLASFTTSTINQLIGSEFGNMYLPWPSSIQERQQISNYLNNKCSSIDALVTRKQDTINKWEEYKKSLIYYAVTGKIDCRNEVIE